MLEYLRTERKNLETEILKIGRDVPRLLSLKRDLAIIKHVIREHQDTPEAKEAQVLITSISNIINGVITNGKSTGSSNQTL